MMGPFGGWLSSGFQSCVPDAEVERKHDRRWRDNLGASEIPESGSEAPDCQKQFIRTGLEVDLDTALEDAGLVEGGRDLTECRGRKSGGASGVSGKRAGCCAGWSIEVRMVQHVERLEPERCRPVLVDREDARDLGVELQRTRSRERVPADISVGAQGWAGVGRGRSAPGGLPDLGEGRSDSDTRDWLHRWHSGTSPRRTDSRRPPGSDGRCRRR